MGEYHRLQQNLLICTLIFSGVIFLSVWLVYSHALLQLAGKED